MSLKPIFWDSNRGAFVVPGDSSVEHNWDTRWTEVPVFQGSTKNPNMEWEFEQMLGGVFSRTYPTLAKFSIHVNGQAELVEGSIKDEALKKFLDDNKAAIGGLLLRLDQLEKKLTLVVDAAISDKKELTTKLQLKESEISALRALIDQTAKEQKNTEMVVKSCAAHAEKTEKILDQLHQGVKSSDEFEKLLQTFRET